LVRSVGLVAANRVEFIEILVVTHDWDSTSIKKCPGRIVWRYIVPVVAFALVLLLTFWTRQIFGHATEWCLSLPAEIASPVLVKEPSSEQNGNIGCNSSTSSFVVDTFNVNSVNIRTVTVGINYLFLERASIYCDDVLTLPGATRSPAPQHSFRPDFPEKALTGSDQRRHLRGVRLDSICNSDRLTQQLWDKHRRFRQP